MFANTRLLGLTFTLCSLVSLTGCPPVAPGGGEGGGGEGGGENVGGGHVAPEPVELPEGDFTTPIDTPNEEIPPHLGRDVNAAAPHLTWGVEHPWFGGDEIRVEANLFRSNDGVKLMANWLTLRFQLFFEDGSIIEAEPGELQIEEGENRYGLELVADLPPDTIGYRILAGGCVADRLFLDHYEGGETPPPPLTLPSNICEKYAPPGLGDLKIIPYSGWFLDNCEVVPGGLPTCAPHNNEGVRFYSTSQPVKARYIVHDAHCAAFDVELWVDNTYVATRSVGYPGNTSHGGLDTGWVPLGTLPEGPHRVELRPKYFINGCVDNNGIAIAWAGTLEVEPN